VTELGCEICASGLIVIITRDWVAGPDGVCPGVSQIQDSRFQMKGAPQTHRWLVGLSTTALHDGGICGAGPAGAHPGVFQIQDSRFQMKGAPQTHRWLVGLKTTALHNARWREVLWSAAACCRFLPRQLAGRAADVVAVRTRAISLGQSGSKLPHSKAPSAGPFSKRMARGGHQGRPYIQQFRRVTSRRERRSPLRV
jgi:hypothetical protein